MSKDRALKGDGNLRHRKDGTWEFRVVTGTGADGNPIRKSFYSKDKSGRGAKQKYRDWLQRQEEEREAQQSMSVKAWAEKWLVLYKEGKVAPQAYRNYKTYVNNHIIPFLGSKSLREVTPADIQALYLAKSHLSASAINHMRIALNGIFESAVENDYCEKNPARKVKPPKVIQKPPTSFTRDEMTRLLAFAKNHADGHYVLALLYTGLRIAELCALRWSEVDLENGELHIVRALAVSDDIGRVYKPKESTKTNKNRVVVLTPDGVDIFSKIPKDGEYVFKGTNKPYRTPDSYRRRYEAVFKALNEAAKKEEDKVRYLSPHKCRHTYASFLLDGGANIRSVQEQLGHARITTTEIYTHVDLESRKKNVLKLRY